MIGFIIGLLRFGLEFGYTIPPCGSLDPDPRPDFVKNWVGGFHYLHFGTFLFFFNVLIAVVVSIMTEPIPEDKVYIFFNAARPRDMWPPGVWTSQIHIFKVHGLYTRIFEIP